MRAKTNGLALLANRLRARKSKKDSEILAEFDYDVMMPKTYEAINEWRVRSRQPATEESPYAELKKVAPPNPSGPKPKPAPPPKAVKPTEKLKAGSSGNGKSSAQAPNPPAPVLYNENECPYAVLDTEALNQPASHATPQPTTQPSAGAAESSAAAASGASDNQPISVEKNEEVFLQEPVYADIIGVLKD